MSKPTILKVTPIGSVAECSTGDITFEDSLILNDSNTPQVSYKNRYGYVIRTNPFENNEEYQETIDLLKKAGLSNKFIEMFDVAHKADHKYLIIDADAVCSREEMDESWSNPEKNGKEISNPDDIKKAIQALPQEELEQICEYAIAGLCLNINEKGDYISLEKDMSGDEFRTHIKTRIEEAGITIVPEE